MVSTQQSHSPDASTGHDVTGGDTVAKLAVNSGLNTLGARINAIIAVLEFHGLMANA